MLFLLCVVVDLIKLFEGTSRSFPAKIYSNSNCVSRVVHKKTNTEKIGNISTNTSAVTSPDSSVDTQLFIFELRDASVACLFCDLPGRGGN